MRKVFLKILLFALLISGAAFSIPSFVAAENISEASSSKFEEEYRYEKVLIDDVVYIFVYTIDWKLVNIYPESCGPHGGG
ncbi:MAG: hypothetical protein K1X86_07415 [Ignavibacteria bacterium]|nr:hypothetical protein [Ignavibacteria bacterium]